MADLTAAPLTTADIRAQYGEMTRRKRLYGGIIFGGVCRLDDGRVPYR